MKLNYHFSITVIRLSLAALELLHALSHLQVLCGIGKLYTVNELLEKRWYFIFDAVTVLVSYVALFIIPAETVIQHRVNKQLTLVLAISHFVLHAYFIIFWYDPTAYFVNAIREWSAESVINNRVLQKGKLTYMINTLGTAFDIFVHIYMFVHFVNMCTKLKHYFLVFTHCYCVKQAIEKETEG